jgi:hypothetical protein
MMVGFLQVLVEPGLRLTEGNTQSDRGLLRCKALNGIARSYSWQ